MYIVYKYGLVMRAIVGESREDLDSERIWTVGLQHEWLMSLQKCHLKGISFDKSILSNKCLLKILNCV